MCLYVFLPEYISPLCILLSRLENIPVCGWFIPRVFRRQQEQQQHRIQIVKMRRTRSVSTSILEDIRGGSSETTSGFPQTQKEGDRNIKKQPQYLTTEDEEWDGLLNEELWNLDLEGLDADEVKALLSDLDLDDDSIDNDELIKMSSKPHHSKKKKKKLPAVDMEEWLQEEVATPVPLEPRRKILQELLEEDSSWGQEEKEESVAEGDILKPSPTTTMLMPPGSLEGHQRAAGEASRITRNQLLKLCILHFGCSILLRRMSTTNADYRFHVKCASGFQCLGCVLCDQMVRRSINNKIRYHHIEREGGARDSLLKSKGVIRVSEVSLLGALKRKAPRNQVHSCALLQPLLLLLFSLAKNVS